MTDHTPLALTNARLIDGSGEEPIADATVIIEDGIISQAGSRDAATIPAGATVYDLAGRTLMPGLIDAHVHLRSPAAGRRVGDYLWQATAFIEEQTLHCAANAGIALECGVTTVRDMAGARPEVSLKHAIDDGALTGARVIASGFVGMTAGHGDMFCPAGIDHRYWQPADGIDECRKLVRRYARDGLDLIKICTSGGVLSTGDKNEWRNYTFEETLAIVDEAHALGMKVAAHAHTWSGIRQAVEASVDTLEHGSTLDDELIERMLERGTYLCPTLAITDFLLRHGREAGIPEESLEKAERLKATSTAGHRKAYAAGVPIFMGTDSSAAFPFGRHASELRLMHEVIGMTPMETIVAATRTAAEALDIAGEVGVVQPGYRADLLVVDGDPLQNLNVLEDRDRIRAVIHQGRVAIDRGLRSAQPAGV